MPVIVLLALALRPVHLQPQLLEFALAVAIVLPLRFGAGYVVRLLPMASRVL